MALMPSDLDAIARSVFAETKARADGRYVRTIRDFIVLSGGDNPEPPRKWWAAIGDPTIWPLPEKAE